MLFALILLLGIAAVSAQDWPMINYDNDMSRHSPQTMINKDNVNQLQVKWILNTNFTIEDPPLIIGKTGYVQTNAIMEVIAFDLETGLTKWTYVPNIATIVKLPRSTSSHGMVYENGVIYAPTGGAGGIVALNADNGAVVWDSGPLQPLGGAFRISAPPLIWKNYVLAGSALGDAPPYGAPAKGTITALDKNTGKILWQINTTVGEWVEGKNASVNGGAATWTGGAIDMDKGIAYMPCGNPAPDWIAVSRPGYNNYSNNVIAVNIADGKILWATPFVAQGTVFNLTLPDTHDWDTTWGTMLITADLGKGPQKIVIGHDKRGDVMAMDAATGKPIWWKNLAVLYNVNAAPTPKGSGPVWPGSGDGIEDYTAFDNSTIYAAVSNQGYNFFAGPGLAELHLVPSFETMPNGIGNGSIVALDIKTGDIKWEHKTDFPTWCSPLVTNGLVFTGQITSLGTPYKYDPVFGGPINPPLISTGILMALDADTGKTLWQFNVGSMVGIGGPSIGNGLLLVPTGGIQTPNAGGYIVAFGLPSGNTTGLTDSQLKSGMATQIIHPVMNQTVNQTAVMPPSGIAGQMPSNVTTTPSTTMATSTANATGNATGSKKVTVGIFAKGLVFNTSTITVPAGAMVTVNFDNMDTSVLHNVAFYTDSSANTPIYVGAVINGPKTTTYTFTAPSKPGTYFFRCDIHPATMVGKFVVQ